MDSVKANAMILLTAADKWRAALGIEREFPQAHGTFGFDRQPAMKCEIQQDWALWYSTQYAVQHMSKIERKKGLWKEIMIITSPKTLKHTIICTYTRI
jgi:hypothetical protein